MAHLGSTQATRARAQPRPRRCEVANVADLQLLRRFTRRGYLSECWALDQAMRAPTMEASQLIVATAMTAVAIHPSSRHGPATTKRSMTLRFAASRTRSTMTGTATMPLITAAHSNAFMGLIAATLAAAPRAVASAIVT